VFVRAVFLQGLFFRDPDTLPSCLSEAGPYLRILRDAARAEGMTVAELALGHVRDLPAVTSLVVGAETVDQVRENLRLFSAPPVSAATNEWLRRAFDDVPERVLNPSLWK
jgi:aryl-alcohol dehydrogenase-like predicted oxidoreductase